MTDNQAVLTIFIVALATALTRFLPFLVFKPTKETPKYLKFLASALPPAVFGMLVVYCFKNISFTAPSAFLPELIATAVVITVHLLFRKMLISIASGTVVYMILVNLVFV